MVLLVPFQIENCACYRQVFSFPLEHFKGLGITQKFFSIRLLFLLLSPFLQIQIKWKLNFNFRCFIYRPHNSKNNTSRVKFSQRVITDGCDFIFTINLTVIVCVYLFKWILFFLAYFLSVFSFIIIECSVFTPVKLFFVVLMSRETREKSQLTQTQTDSKTKKRNEINAYEAIEKSIFFC